MWFEPVIQDSGIKDFTWHCLRHTFASRLRMKGVPLEDIADLLGHKTLAMTVRYVHPSTGCSGEASPGSKAGLYGEPN